MNLADIAKRHTDASQTIAEAFAQRLGGKGPQTEKVEAALAKKPPQREDARHRKGERVLGD